MNDINLQSVVDELGRIRAEKDLLKVREEELRDIIKNADVPVALGERFEAKRVESDRSTVNWKAVAEHFNPSRQLLTAHTKVSHVVTIRTNVRKDVLAQEATS